MILDIVGVSASWDENRLHVAFDIAPEGRSHLDLKTGEIFQSSKYAAFKKEEHKAISARLYVTRKDRSANGQDLPSDMRYIQARGDQESMMMLVWRLPGDLLADFHALILGGRVPKQAIVSFPSDALTFGWEPDGSGEKWDNEKTSAVPIESVSFNFALEAPSIDRPWDAQIRMRAIRNFLMIGRGSISRCCASFLGLNPP